MIRVTALPGRRDDDTGFEFPNRPRNNFARHGVVDDGCVWQSKILSCRELHDRCRPVGFCGARLRVAARTHFAGSEIHDRGLAPLFRRLDQRAGAGELDVVAMGSNGQDIDGH
jgi:hypothetical protein